MASISSRIYMGAGLNWRRAIIGESIIRDLVECMRVNVVFRDRIVGAADFCPPLSSVKLCFQMLPSWKLTSTMGRLSSST
jgi:hypothetical protein